MQVSFQPYVHQICRREFTDEKRLNISSTDVAIKNNSTLRSSVGFDWKTNCSICSKQAIIDIRYKDRNDVQDVRSLQICANAFQKSNQRNDEFTRSIKGRLQTCIDLVAEEAVYHRTCFQKFLSNEGECNPVGRPFSVNSNNAFNKLCLWLEKLASTNLLTLDELHEKMERFSESNEAYLTKWLIKKLKDRYSDHLFCRDSQS